MLTAVTAQNTTAVLGVRVLEPDFVDLQIEAVSGRSPRGAVKTGMLASAAIVAVVARRAAAGDLPQLVVDPVMVTSTGTPLLDEDGVAAYLELLLPHAAVCTPNIREAALLTAMAGDRRGRHGGGGPTPGRIRTGGWWW